MNAAEVRAKIEAGLPGSRVEVETSDDTHFAARVIAPQFAGKRALARHQLVYAALGQVVGRELHALSIEALTPDEWAASGRS